MDQLNQLTVKNDTKRQHGDWTVKAVEQKDLVKETPERKTEREKTGSSLEKPAAHVREGSRLWGGGWGGFLAAGPVAYARA